MAVGTVMWFNDASGYGFIAADEGGDHLYVRQASIVGDSERTTLTSGERVEFESRIGGMGPEAISVSLQPGQGGGGR
jgi:CspA family cold shock protein